MNWYLAKIVFQIICGNGDHTAQFDEQLRLISAHHKEEAFEKATQLGLNEQDSFYNIHKQPVRWSFVNVSELYRLEELLDGAEIYSKIKETPDALEYRRVINNKAEMICRSNHPEILTLA